jgi:hypothetical protein
MATVKWKTHAWKWYHESEHEQKEEFDLLGCLCYCDPFHSIHDKFGDTSHQHEILVRNKRLSIEKQ